RAKSGRREAVRVVSVAIAIFEWPSRWRRLQMRTSWATAPEFRCASLLWRLRGRRSARRVQPRPVRQKAAGRFDLAARSGARSRSQTDQDALSEGPGGAATNCRCPIARAEYSERSRRD